MLHLEQVERQSMTNQIVAATFIAAGRDVEMPVPGSLRAEFDEALEASPEPLSPSQVRLRALGVA